MQTSARTCELCCAFTIFPPDVSGGLLILVRIVRHIHVGGGHVGLNYSYNRVDVAAEDVGVRKEKERRREGENGEKGITRLRDASTIHVTIFPVFGKTYTLGRGNAGSFDGPVISLSGVRTWQSVGR